MRYVAAYLLAVLGGNETPSAADIEKVLSSVGIDADAERLKLVVGQLKGKNIEDLIKEGKYSYECHTDTFHVITHSSGHFQAARSSAPCLPVVLLPRLLLLLRPLPLLLLPRRVRNIETSTSPIPCC